MDNPDQHYLNKLFENLGGGKLLPILEQIPLPLVISAPDGNVIYVNEPAARMLGRPEGNGLPDQGSFWPRISGNIEHPAAAALAAGRPLEMAAVPVFRRDLQQFHRFRVSALPLTGRNGDAVAVAMYFQAVAEDGPETPEQHAGLLEERKRLDILLNNDQESSLLIAPDGEILLISRIGAERLGHSPEDLAGRNLFDLFPDDVAAFRKKQIDEAVEGKVACRWTDERNGMLFEQTVHPVLNEAGEVERIAIYARDITAAARTEESLRRSEASLAKAQEISRMGNWIWEIATNAVNWSQAMYKLLEVNPGDLGETYEAFLSLVHPEDRERVRCSLADAVFEEKDFDQEFRLLRPHGSEMTVHALAELVYDGIDEPVRMVGTLQDITERKIYEEKLRESEKSLAESQRLAGLGNFEWDIRAGKVDWSREMYNLLGVDPLSEKPALNSFLKTVHPDDAEYVRKNLEHLLMSRQVLKFDYRVIPEQGTLRYFQTSSEVIRDKDGQAVKIVGTVQDITDRKLAEEVSWELASIVESSGDAIISESLQGIVKTWNTGAENIYGYTATEMIGHSILQIIPEDRRDEYRQMLEQIRQGNKVDHFETVRSRKDGRMIPMDLTLSPIRDHRGSISGASTVGRDISERKEAERELRIKECAIQSSINAIIMADTAGRISYVNRACLMLWGYDDLSDISGLDMSAFIADKEKGVEANRVVLKKGGWIGELKAVRRDGSLFDILASGNRVLDENGRTICLMYSFVDITEKKQVEELLRIQAVYDSLTGLFNRRHFMEKLQAEMSEARRHDYPLSVAIGDLDHFKAVNDKYGHKVGDDVLEAFGGLLMSELRVGDVAGRYGGEEFAFVFPHTPLASAASVLDRVRRHLGEQPFQDSRGNVFFISVSFGVVQMSDPTMTLEELLEDADNALYQAKSQGRNRIVATG